MATQVEERGAREPLVDGLCLRPGDSSAGEASPLERRVDRPHYGLEQLRVGLVLGDRVAEPAERRRIEPRQLDLQGQVCRRQTPKILEQLTELGVREPSKLPGGLPGDVGEEGSREAFLRWPALDAAAALCLATRAAGTGLVAPDLRHDRIVT